MIKRKLNLVCPNGHRFYARHPEAWEGKTCGRAAPDATARERGCQARLRILAVVPATNHRKES